MKTYSKSSELYIGRNAGEELSKEVLSVKKSLKIVSPYLTPSYVEDLLKLANKGIEVTLITSNDVEQGDGRYSDLSHTDIIKQKRIVLEEERNKRKKGLFYSGISTLIGFFIIMFFFSIGILIILIGAGIFFYYYNKSIYNYEYYSPFKLKVVPDEYHDLEKGEYLIHSKIYVIDEKIAYTGSVNFTHKGFRYNFENLTKIKDPSAVKRISLEIDRLFNDNKLYSKSIDEWGKELYNEPKN